MPLMIVRAGDLGVTGREKPAALDANTALLERLESLRLEAGRRMGLGDVSDSVIPKPVLVSAGDSNDSITSRYFTPRKCHASHAVRAPSASPARSRLPGTVASGAAREPGRHSLVVLHPAGQIDVEVELNGSGGRRHGRARRARPHGAKDHARRVASARLRVLASRSDETSCRSDFPHKALTIIVPTRAGGGNDTMARIIAAKLGPLLGQEVLVDNRAGANGAIASEYVADAAPDGHTLMFGYVGTHAMNPALQRLGYDPVADFEPVGLVGSSPTLMVTHPDKGAADLHTLIARLKDAPRSFSYASAGDGTPPHFAAELFQLSSGTSMASATYEGAAPAIADTVNGRSQIMFPSLSPPTLSFGRAIARLGGGRAEAAGRASRRADARGAGCRGGGCRRNGMGCSRRPARPRRPSIASIARSTRYWPTRRSSNASRAMVRAPSREAPTRLRTGCGRI